MNRSTEKASYDRIRLSSAMRGVFSVRDIAALYGVQSESGAQARARSLVKAGVLRRVGPGLLADENATLESVASRMFPDGYISLGYALARYGLVGTFTATKINILTTRPRGRTYDTPLGKIKMSVQDSRMQCGFEVRDGLRIADPEKAVIDTLYFYLRGEKYPFDVYSDINLDGLDERRIETYLSLYRNPKFQAFARGVIE